MAKMKIGTKITVMTIAIVTVVILVAGLFSYSMYKRDMTEEYGKRAISIAELTALNIDPDQIARYDQTGEKDAEYQALKDYLSEIKNETDAYYLYVFTDTGSEFKYIVEGVTEGQTGQTDLNDTDGYDAYGEEPHDVFSTGVSETSDIYYGGEEYGDLISAFVPIKDGGGNTIALLGMDLSPKEIQTAMSEYLLIMLIILLAADAVTYGVIRLLIGKILTKPINKLTEASKQLADGNVNLDIEIRSKDELGQLALSFGKVVGTLNGLIGDVTSLMKFIGEGDYNRRADISAYQGEYRNLIDGMNKTVDSFMHVLDRMPAPVFSIDKDYRIKYINQSGAEFADRKREELRGVKCCEVFRTGDCNTERCACRAAMLNRQNEVSETDAHPSEDESLSIRYNAIPIMAGKEAIGAVEIITDLTDINKAKDAAERQADTLNKLMQKVNVAAEEVAAGTDNVSAGSQSISQGATEQASAVEELSSSIASIAAEIRDNVAKTTKARELVLEAKECSVTGNRHMEKMQTAMAEINESSENISKIIKVIDNIAFQTNILALNAAVEAARAGTHGKGFAVVAQEVRNLAGMSAKAAQQTTELIENSIKKVETGSELARITAESLEKILEETEESAKFFDEIASAMNEQATGIAQINLGIEQVSQVVQANTATAVQAAAASEQLSGQADMLKSLVRQYEN